MNINYIYIFAGAMLIVIFLFAYFSHKVLRYKRKDKYMTSTELRMYRKIKELTRGKYYIVPQVVISSIIEPRTKNKSIMYAERNKIDRKTVDFVLFEEDGFTPYMAIEVNDPSHKKKDRIERDNFVKEAFKEAEIKLEMISNESELEKLFEEPLVVRQEIEKDVNTKLS